MTQFSGSRLKTSLRTELLFNRNTSLYVNRATQTKTDTTHSEKRLVNLVKDVDITVYKNLSNHQILSREYVLNRVITVQDTLRELPWQLGTQSRQIGKFSCQNASVVFRGRTYEAWFTMDIPVPYGPWKLGGLPGLIIEASDAEKEVTFNLISIKYPLSDNMIVHTLPVKQAIPYAAYRDVLDDKLRNMEKFLQGAGNSANSKYEVNVRTQPSMIERSVK